MKYELIENFFDENIFKKYKNLMFHCETPWYLVDYANPNSEKNDFENQVVFCNALIDSGRFIHNKANIYLDPIMNTLKKHKPNCGFDVLGAKVNLFIKNNHNVKYGFHYDIGGDNDLIKYGKIIDTYDTLIYYLNNNNGGTEFEDGTFVKQKENTALLFKGRVLHQSVGQTDTKYRINVNINFLRN